jgi:hypothetical protein
MISRFFSFITGGPSKASGKQRISPGHHSSAAKSCAAPHVSGGPPGPLIFTTEVPPRKVDRPYFVSDGRVGAGEIRRFARACHDR